MQFIWLSKNAIAELFIVPVQINILHLAKNFSLFYIDE